jgi:hypothetical protein
VYITPFNVAKLPRLITLGSKFGRKSLYSITIEPSFSKVYFLYVNDTYSIPVLNARTNSFTSRFVFSKSINSSSFTMSVE